MAGEMALWQTLTRALPPMLPPVNARAWLTALAHRIAMLCSGDSDGEGVDVAILARGRVYSIDSFGYLLRPRNGYVAVGAGAAVAMGSLYTSVGNSHRQRVFRALGAAERHASMVKRPFAIRVCNGK